MLRQQDGRSIPDAPEEMRLFSVIRNEEHRLPYFLHYYTSLGVNRFFFIDNDSTDATIDILLREPNVHVFRASGSFAEAKCGSIWLQYLVSRFADGRWAAIADADELLVYPGWEDLPLAQFCGYLSTEDVNAFHCILVDMYSDRPFAETKYIPGSNPLELCPYFESDTILCVTPLHDLHFDSRKIVGGVRYRLFNLPVRLDKVGLIKYHPAMRFYVGQHELGGAKLSRLRGAMLHFKFLSTFHERAAIEADRGEHWQEGEEYKRYAAVSANASLTAYSELSKRFTGSADLLESRIMQQNETFVKYLESIVGAGAGHSRTG